MDIGIKLKQLRNERGYTLEVLSELLNQNYPGELSFNKGLLSKWENRKTEPRLSSVRMLADFYGISIDELNPDYTSTQSTTKLADIQTDQSILAGEILKMGDNQTIKAIAALIKLEEPDLSTARNVIFALKKHDSS